jgi:hypothetical protein
MMISRRGFALAFAGAGLLALPFSARRARAADKPLVVVELFTSQGCHSCPPAEAYLGELARRDDVLALEFHVDYWDYIGWKDPFADPAFTERQSRYNRRLGSRYNYTPQMVIDGREHEVGSRRGAVDARIEAAGMKRMMMDAPRPDLTLTPTDDGGLTVRLDGAPQEPGTYRVLLIGFDRRHETDVTRGENTGKRLVNANVVRKLKEVGPEWTGGPLEIQVAAAQLAGDKGCAILVQDPATGAIAAAAEMAY